MLVSKAIRTVAIAGLCISLSAEIGVNINTLIFRKLYAVIVVGGEVVQHLWNWLPELFGWRQITIWQAAGLLALCRICSEVEAL